MLAIPIAYSVFDDVLDLHPYSEAILYVQSENIVSGYGDGTFRPERSVTRAEFTKIVVEAQFEDQAIDIADVSGLS